MMKNKLKCNGLNCVCECIHRNNFQLQSIPKLYSLLICNYISTYVIFTFDFFQMIYTLFETCKISFTKETYIT